MKRIRSITVLLATIVLLVMVSGGATAATWSGTDWTHKYGTTYYGSVELDSTVSNTPTVYLNNGVSWDNKLKNRWYTSGLCYPQCSWNYKGSNYQDRYNMDITPGQAWIPTEQVTSPWLPESNILVSVSHSYYDSSAYSNCWGVVGWGQRFNTVIF